MNLEINNFVTFFGQKIRQNNSALFVLLRIVIRSYRYATLSGLAGSVLLDAFNSGFTDDNISTKHKNHLSKLMKQPKLSAFSKIVIPYLFTYPILHLFNLIVEAMAGTVECFRLLIIAQSGMIVSSILID